MEDRSTVNGCWTGVGERRIGSLHMEVERMLGRKEVGRGWRKIGRRLTECFLDPGKGG